LSVADSFGEIGAATPRRSVAGLLLWAAGEIFVVVAGVLIAFGLNAWWSERATRAEEQTHLRALLADFEHNVGLLSDLLRREEQISSASLELLQLARKQPDADAAEVYALLNRVFQSLRTEPVLDAYEALVNSAGLALIRDEELRSDLAGFAARSADPYFERFADQLYVTFTTQFAGRLQFGTAVAGDASALQPYTELLGDPAFQEHLALRHLVERDVAIDYRERLQAAQGIVEQLKAEIDD
jgi:hypothetical protein